MGSIVSVSETQEQRLQRLSDIEERLIGRLQETSSKQKQAYNALDTVVAQGYDYYNQSYEEKRMMQGERMLPAKSLNLTPD